jgi:NADH-quinone oxidoreductase subunit J
MPATLLYTICALGAAALYLLVRPFPPHARALKGVGIVLALAAFAWFLAAAAEHLAPEPGEPGRPAVFYAIFSLIALGSSIRLITHPRPVYSALYFVMVVLSSAALFLLLGAEFMAFALVIVYAGAILITYMFVLMLAQQAESPTDAAGQPEYDRVPREPATAAVVGFILMALLTTMIFEGARPVHEGGVPDAPSPRQAALRELALLEQLPRELQARVDELQPGAVVVEPDVRIRDDRAFVLVQSPEADAPVELELPLSAVPPNIHQVGVALVAKFPVSLELAGIILLLAMFGAAVLARRQMELGEDELREAAGLERLSPRDDADQSHGGGGLRR